jgi:hypothetical protein
MKLPDMLAVASSHRGAWRPSSARSRAPRVAYRVMCRDAAGRPLWTVEARNTVTVTGMDKLLDACFVGSLAAPAWFPGLMGLGPADFADTGDAWRVDGTGPVNLLQRHAARLRAVRRLGQVRGRRGEPYCVRHRVRRRRLRGVFLADDDEVDGAAGTLYRRRRLRRASRRDQRRHPDASGRDLLRAVARFGTPRAGRLGGRLPTDACRTCRTPTHLTGSVLSRGNPYPEWGDTLTM